MPGGEGCYKTVSKAEASPVSPLSPGLTEGVKEFTISPVRT